MNFNLLDSNTRQELLTWYETIRKQNYFTDKGNKIIQKDVVGMGVPSTGILPKFSCSTHKLLTLHT
jgi:hypothetical protein